MKIGYANMGVIVSQMPETKSIPIQLEQYTNELAAPLRKKGEYINAKYRTYKKARDSNMHPDELRPLETELQMLQHTLEAEQNRAEAKLVKKEKELQKPLSDKIQAAIKKIAKTGNYTYILNTGLRTSPFLIKGPNETNVTLQILTELGIEIPSTEE